MGPRAARGVSATAVSRNPARGIAAIDPHAIDAAIALALTAAALAILLARNGDDGTFRANDFLGTGLILLQTLPLAARRVYPLGVAVVIAVAIGLHAAIGYEMVQPGTFASLVATYGVASLCDIRRALVGAAVAAVAIVLFFTTYRGGYGAVDGLSTAGTWAIAWLFGVFIRIRGQQAEAAGEHAALLERDHDLRARAAVAEERARMARELHDIVGHALNVIVIQAGGARRALDARPQVARDALASIETAGREALSDMERMLGVLHAAGEAMPALGPQPGIAQVDALAAQVSDAGLAVEVVREGTSRELAASMELSAYRIVQEALTNALKHAAASRARVVLRYSRDALEVEVSDDGLGARGAGGSVSGGRGIVGMRERVALFDGELETGNAPGGGYRVRARLPVRDTTA
jgi:signal transduction histidine kinase